MSPAEPQTQACLHKQSPQSPLQIWMTEMTRGEQTEQIFLFGCLFVLCSSSLSHWCHLGFFVEETHQHSDGSCLVPSAQRRRVPRVTREDCRSCREGCSAGGVSPGNTTIVSLPSVPWHLETFRVGEKAESERRGVPRACTEGQGAGFTPRCCCDDSHPARQGKRKSILQVAVSCRTCPMR